MDVKFRNYTGEPLYTEDYVKVRDFLVRLSLGKLHYPRFLWYVWEWGLPFGAHNLGKLEKIGLWEEAGRIVGVATYESTLGEGFLIIDDDYSFLKPEMVNYAKKTLCDETGKLRLIIDDSDYGFQRTAMEQGLRPLRKADHIAALDVDLVKDFSLPDGFKYVSMADDWNWQQYNRVLWRGFNHEGLPPHDEKQIANRKLVFNSPLNIPEIKISVMAPDGNYISHCGMWYRPGDHYCFVEPVVTVPEYRKMGFGKACVLEGVRRCGELGAKQAVVGSDQQFYYNIGFYPVATLTYWEL